MVEFEELREKLEDTKARPKGVTMDEILSLPPLLSTFLTRLIRKRSMTLPEFQSAVALSEEESQTLIDLLLEKGFLKKVTSRRTGITKYRIKIARAHQSNLPSNIWDALD